MARVMMGGRLGGIAHISEQTVNEVSVDDNAMDTPNGEEDKEPDEGRVVGVTNTTVNPGAVVIHLQHTSEEEQKEERKEAAKEEEERKSIIDGAHLPQVEQ